MRLKYGPCRSCAFLLVLVAVSCATQAPAVIAPTVVSPAAPPAAPVSSSGAPPIAAPEPIPVPPEKPFAERYLPSPALARIAPLSEEPESPFGESPLPAEAPAEPVVALSEAPLPEPPEMAEPSKPPIALFPPSSERPETSPPVAVQSPAAEPKKENPQASVQKRTAPPAADRIVKEPAVQAPASPVPAAPSVVPVAAAPPIEFSRKVRLTVGQLLEIPYRGNGWIFLGEQNAKKGLPYDSRRLDDAGQSFMFRAEAEGVYALKFYRQDFVNDYIVNDFVQATIEPAPASSAIGGFSPPVDRGRIVAEPRWPIAPASSASSPAVESAGGAPSASAPASTSAVAPKDPGIEREAAVVPSSVVPPSVVPAASNTPFDPASIPATAPIEEFLAAARKEADAGRAQTALAVLDRMRGFYPAGSDEAWWLYGKLLEANGASKDVKSSLSYYRRLVDEYPQSPRYDEARKRIAYLQRFYFEIR